MNKALCVAGLLLGTIALTGRHSTAAPVGPDYPQVVAKGKLLNQNAPIATTTIYTPTQTGLYRLSIYATLTTANPSSDGWWDYTLGWTDDSGAQSIDQFLYQNSNTPGPFEYLASYPSGGGTQPFEAKAGTPITYSLAQPNGPDGSVYSLYYILERTQ
jgi:hypothetical protein